MKLRVFQSDKGDCLLLTSKDGKRILADGGMRSSYRAHVAPAMGQLQSAGEQLDLLYVSHIDRDHISGVLQLLDDLVVGAIEQMLAASASVLEAGSAKPVLAEAASQRDLATSVPEGLELSRRASPEQLNIDVNKEFGGDLILVRKEKKRNTVKLGSLELTVVGPFKEELDDLRKEWNAWLRDHGKALEDLRRRMREDAKQLEAGAVEDFRAALALRAGEERNQAHMREVEQLVAARAKASKGRLRYSFLDGHAFEIRP